MDSITEDELKGMFAGEKADDNDQLKQTPANDIEKCGAMTEAIKESSPLVSGQINPIAETKMFRQDLDALLQNLKNSTRKSRERSIAITKLQEAIMWLGMDLKDMGTPNPYPQSYNPSNDQIEPTADGLKL